MQNGCFLKHFAEWSRAKANTDEKTVAQGDETMGMELKGHMQATFKNFKNCIAHLIGEGGFLYL